MSTFWQVLRLAFWINPLHRTLTAVGLIIMAIFITVACLYYQVPPSWAPQYALGLMFLGPLAVSAACMVAGGIYWRLASAPRIVRLAPRGRARLLGSVLALVVLVAVLWNLQYWVYFLLWANPGFSSLADHLTGLLGSAITASVAIVGLFVASRSPFAALVVLAVLMSPGLVVTWFDLEIRRYIGRLSLQWMMLAAIWIPFGCWYLRTRRISRPRWLASGGDDVLATALTSAAGPASQREAVERLLLGGTTVIRLGLQWLLLLGLLLALQWVLAQLGEGSEPRLVARVMVGSLCIVPIIASMVGFAAARRSRALWLLCASTRHEFFTLIERILLRMNLALVLVATVWLAVIWFGYRAPGSLLEQLSVGQMFWFATLWVLGLFAVYAQLASLPKWLPTTVAVAVMAVLWWLSATTGTPRGLSAATAGMACTVLVATASVLMVALRWQSLLRWRSGDFPRFVTSQAS